jgi:hypothetical protein
MVFVNSHTAVQQQIKDVGMHISVAQGEPLTDVSDV